MTEVEKDWPNHAHQLASMLALPDSRWFGPIASTPRHLLIPRWFERHADGVGWHVREGSESPHAWMAAAYRKVSSIVTKVGPHHADGAMPGERVGGRTTSSGTNPWRVLEMYRAARIHRECGDVLDVGTGPGYGAALLCKLVGQEHVTTVDVDPYITEAARDRLAGIGHAPSLITADATGPLDWQGDRIVATVAVPAIPASWIGALRTGGRLAVNIAGTMITITARKQEDGSAWGRVEFDYRGGFMHTRSADDYAPSGLEALFNEPEASGDVSTGSGRFPVIDLDEAAELSSVLALTVPGIGWSFSQSPEGWRVARLAHADGSWAKAEGQGVLPPVVHQGGPRRLWDELDRLRSDWLSRGSLRLYGAEVHIKADGAAYFKSGPWHVTLPAAAQDQPAAQRSDPAAAPDRLKRH